MTFYQVLELILELQTLILCSQNKSFVPADRNTSVLQQCVNAHTDFWNTKQISYSIRRECQMLEYT